LPEQATVPPSPPPEELGLVERMKKKMSGILSDTKAVMDVKAHYINLKQSAEQWIEHIINIIVIFLLQTLVIPLLLMWVLYAVARGTFEMPVKVASGDAK